MKLAKYIACICEGSAEQAIIELLLDADKLIFNRSRLLEGEIIRSRKGSVFEQRYLRKGFSDKITVLRILDLRREKFRISEAYAHKIDVVNIVTAPEVEMLIIFNEGKYTDYKKSGLKPSEFCKTALHYTNVKSLKFVRHYFNNIQNMVDAIHEYKRVSDIPKGLIVSYVMDLDVTEQILS